jgi:hypothetical protein
MKSHGNAKGRPKPNNRPGYTKKARQETKKRYTQPRKGASRAIFLSKAAKGTPKKCNTRLSGASGRKNNPVNDHEAEAMKKMEKYGIHVGKQIVLQGAQVAIEAAMKAVKEAAI